MFYIYILYSVKFDKFYVGQTDDVDRRLIEHNELSDHSYTSKYRPWQIAASFKTGDSRTLARKIESHIKKQKSKGYIEEIIERGSITGLIERFGGNG